MAGTKSSFSIDDYQTTHSEGLEFAFDLEASISNPIESSFDTSIVLQTGITSEIEFFPRKRFAYWRSGLILFFAVLAISTGFFYLNPMGKNKLQAGLFGATKPAQSQLTITPNSAIKTPPRKEEVLEKTDLTTEAQESIKEFEIPSFESSKADIIPSEEIAEIPVVPATPSEPSAPIAEPKKEIKINKAKPKGFKTTSLAEAKRLAASTGRYVFIKFGAEWCISCKLMESSAMKDEKVMRLLEEKFVVLDVDVDQAKGSKIKNEYYVDKLPTLIVLDELGNQMRRKETALGTSKLIEMLESVVPYIYLEEEALTAQVSDFESTE